MQKKIRISIAAIVALMLIILAVNLAMGATSVANTSGIEANKETVEKLDSEESVTVDDYIVISPEQAEDKEKLKALAPETLEEAESSIYPVRCRFILWTYDGMHIMWGIYGNGRFVGTDNLGKRCWGIYGKGVFAGFYDGEFFWGKYANGAWTAEYLFGLERSRGEYVLFQPPAITTNNAIYP